MSDTRPVSRTSGRAAPAVPLNPAGPLAARQPRGWRLTPWLFLLVPSCC